MLLTNNNDLNTLKFEEIKIDDASYNEILQFFERNTKITFKFYRRKFIERRLKSRMIRVNCKTLKAYKDYVLSNPNEITLFSEGFNINFSFFFRNSSIFFAFESYFLYALYKDDNVLKRTANNDIINTNFQKKHRKSHQTPINPEILKQSSIYRKINERNYGASNKINIWSCPCASGEEPYTIAMILNNLSEQITRFPDYKIRASDIDRSAIERATNGIYNEPAMKEITKYFKEKFFTKIDKGTYFLYKINPKVKNKIQFVEENVIKNNSDREIYDIIFCRNFLIYLDRQNRDEFLRILEMKLAKGGILFLGKTETLFSEYRSLKIIDSENHVYIKT